MHQDRMSSNKSKIDAKFISSRQNLEPRFLYSIHSIGISQNILNRTRLPVVLFLYLHIDPLTNRHG